MLAVAKTFSLVGVEAHPVAVEVHVGGGLPSFAIVGLPDAAVRESRERVRAALANAGFEFPMRRITANLAPADLRKYGPGFDLAIAAALLAATGQLSSVALARHALAGELALDGSIRPVPGALCMAEAAAATSLVGIAVAREDGPEAALVDGVDVLPLAHLAELRLLEQPPGQRPPRPRPAAEPRQDADRHDIAVLRGQPALRRALEIAAAGGHSLLLLGPPGAGKTLAARSLPSLLPPLSRPEALEATRIASAHGQRERGRLCSRPFRAPHHTISTAGLVGGGTPPRIGEVTLAHRGVLFLDELGEFSRSALEALRQPLEEGRVAIVRVGHRLELPCRFQLVAASNPCPCGRGQASGECRCAHVSVERYRAKLSGALSDRIDLAIGVAQPDAAELAAVEGEEGSAAIRERVIAARERQRRRLGDGRCNADMGPDETRRLLGAEDDAGALLADGQRRLGLSGRGYDRVCRVARTIADLAGAGTVGTEAVAEALSLRRRDAWG